MNLDFFRQTCNSPSNYGAPDQRHLFILMGLLMPIHFFNLLVQLKFILYCQFHIQNPLIPLDTLANLSINIFHLEYLFLNDQDLSIRFKVEFQLHNYLLFSIPSQTSIQNFHMDIVLAIIYSIAKSYLVDPKMKTFNPCVYLIKHLNYFLSYPLKSSDHQSPYY